MSDAVTPAIVAAFRLMMRQQGLRPEDASSTVQCNKLGELLRGHRIAESLARPSVEAALDGEQVVFGEHVPNQESIEPSF